MNNITLKSSVLVSSIISIMSIEELFCNGLFNGPVFDPGSVALNEDSRFCTICKCCDGCTK